MEISWLGHACFRIRGKDVTILTDPFGGEDWAYPPVASAADVVTISHEHPHHSYLDSVAGTPRVLRGPGEYELRGAMVWGVRTHRRQEPSSDPPPKNTCYVIQLEDLTICHLGDLGHPLSADELDQIKDSDILLIPVGGHCTVGADQAAEIVAQVEPRITIPMHYATPETEGHLLLEGPDRFLREMGAEGLAPQGRLSVTASSLPAEPRVVLLDRRA